MALIDFNQAILLVIFYAILKVWGKFGGWPEAYSRARGINYLQGYFITESGKIMRPLFKFSQVKHHSPSMIRWETKHGGTGGDYLIGVDNAKFANPHNAPAWLWKYDDARPIPVSKFDAQRCDPSLISNGFDDHSFEELNKSKLPQGMFQNNKSMVFFLLGIAGLIAIDIWYNYNVNCALKTLICR
jgi:hypothetical protein